MHGGGRKPHAEIEVAVEVVAAATARSHQRSMGMRRGTFKFEMACAFKQDTGALRMQSLLIQRDSSCSDRRPGKKNKSHASPSLTKYVVQVILEIL